jgi:hypothetical protein
LISLSGVRSAIIPRMPRFDSRSALCGALISSAILAATVARAQPCAASRTPSDLTTARSLFEQGQADVNAHRWADAIARFEQSYTLSCAPSALFNLGMALRALGRHRDARDVFDRFTTNHAQSTEPPYDRVPALREEEARRVAVLELAGISSDQRPSIHFDGELVADSGLRPVHIETDAGTHSLSAQIPDHSPFLWEGTLADGQRATIDVVFSPLPGGGESFEIWPILVGVGAAVLVGVAIGVGIYLQDQAQLRPLVPGRTMEFSL